MRKHIGSIIALFLFAGIGFTAPFTATAQNQDSGVTQPPKVLVIIREYLKPGKGGRVHEKSEQTFVQAMSDAKSSTHYFAANSLSGKTRALFFLGYPSFADWGKDNETLMSNSTLAQQFDSAQQADGELLTSMDQGVFVFQPDKSVSPGMNLGQVRYIEITMLKVRVGHDDDWGVLAKLHNQVFGNMPNAHWDMFKKMYGQQSGGLYIVIRGMHSLAELDQFHTAAKQAWSSARVDHKKRMNDLEASTFESVETNLYAINPKMSYPTDKWKAGDPDFWGQK